ncbi:MAG TPA: hypothetical protein PLJ11_05170 [Methanomassiliicoccales archaeon]|nr:hypothetical protein [Methanomassiliicoccales archaeon]
MRKIVRESGELYLLDTAKDLLVFNGRKHQGARQDRWLELWLHRTEGAAIYYVAHMTRWPGETSYLEAVSAEQAADLVGGNIDRLSDEDLRSVERLGLIDLSALR